MEFGAFVDFFGSKDGLVHISQLSKGRVAKTTDVVKEGDKVKVKLIGFDDRGKVRLSMRVVDSRPAPISKSSRRLKTPPRGLMSHSAPRASRREKAPPPMRLRAPPWNGRGAAACVNVHLHPVSFVTEHNA